MLTIITTTPYNKTYREGDEKMLFHLIFFIIEVEFQLHREFLRVALYLDRKFPNFIHLRSFKFV